MKLWRRLRGWIWHYRAARLLDDLDRHEMGSYEWERAYQRVERLFL